MPKLIIVLVILVALAAVFYFQTAPAPGEPAAPEPSVATGEVFTVTLRPEGYDPAEFTIPVGTTVEFISVTGKPHWPASNLHPTHDIYPAFDPQRPVDPDASWSFTFDEAGDWNFHDHLRAYYTGTVHVVPQ